jgi:hypothetical protein
MRNSSRLTIIRCLAFTALVLFLAATCWAQKRAPIIEEIAKTYGLDSFDQIEAVRYTFSIQIPALKFNLSRAWEWEPKTGKVSYEGKDKDGKPVKVTYVRSQLSSAPDNVKNDIEPAFVNDNYWFIFPFHAYWDKGADIEDKGMQKLPLGTGSARLVSVKYPAEAGGYTPGDTWDLYVGKDNRIVEMFYHRGGPKKPSGVIAKWLGHKKAGPLLVSTDHPGTADGAPLNVTFTNVAVKLTGSDKWMPAQ